ncbi:MAG: helix-turn-helix domain-containing protein [Alphaproteobacteria bacterium]
MEPHEEIKMIRRALNLTQKELGAMCDTDAQTIRRIEMNPDRNTARAPAPRMLRLIRAYAEGYRPKDWPK